MPGFRRGQVVAITGASTGIGRATALEFAGRGARLVLVARQKEKLDELARECSRLGVESMTVSLDVADKGAVLGLVQAIEHRFGALHVWVNNAGVGVIGSFTDVPLEEHERVIQTNLLGYLYGSYAAMQLFRRQGFGTLINNASICSRLVTPHLASYTASKFAIRGLTHSIQQDIAVGGWKQIHACQLNPGVVDTPAFQHAGNFSGLPVEIRMPMTTAEHVARAIVGLADHPRREIFVGPLTGLGSFAYSLFPALTAAVLTFAVKRFYFAEGKQEGPTTGNLHGPVRDQSGESGGWKADRAAS